MKHIHTFEDFVNENFSNSLLEKKTLAPKNITDVFGGDKKGANDLKKWSFKIGDLEFKFKDIEYYSSDTWLPGFFNGEKDETWDYIRLTCNGKEFEVKLKNKGASLGMISKISAGGNRVEFDLDKRTFGNYIDFEDNKLEGFAKLLTFLFEHFSKQLEEEFNIAVGARKVYVIKAGEIAPATGKTAHGWSIYDNKKSEIFIVNGSYTSLGLFAAKGTFKVGEKITLLDDQTGKPLGNGGAVLEVTKIIKPTYDEFVKYSKERGLEIPVGSFQKQPGKGRLTLYSVK